MGNATMRLRRRLLLLLLQLATTGGAVVESLIAALRAVNAAPSNAPATLPPTGVTEALPDAFMPLCGNGRIDTRQQADGGGGWLTHMQGGVLRTFRVLADERCDDGNRADGDGCASDCMALDAWTPPCELDLVGNEDEDAYEHIAFLNGTHALALRAGGLYLLDVPGRRLLTPPLAPKDWLASSALLEREGNHSADWALYAHQPGVGVHVTTARASAFQPFFRLEEGGAHVRDESLFVRAPADWPDDARTWLVLLPLVVGANVTLLSIHSGARFSVALPEGTAPFSISYVGFWTQQQGAIAASSRTVITLGTTAMPARTLHLYPGGPLVWGLKEDATPPTTLWGDALQRALRTESVPVPAFDADATWALEYAPTQPNGAATPPAWDTVNRLPSLFSPLTLVLSRNTPRDALEHTAVFQRLGPDLALRALLTPGGGAAEQCTAAGPCALDLPVCYDLLRPLGAIVPNGSFYDALVRAGDRVLPNATAANARETLLRAFATASQCPTRPRVRQVLQHPATGAMWIVRGASVFEIGRAGTQAIAAPDGSRCAPSYVRAPCPARQWAPSTGGCVPCTEHGAPAELGFAQACGAPPPWLAYAVVASSASSSPDPTNFSAALATRGARCEARGDARACVEPDIGDAAAALRSLGALVAATGGRWSVVEAPRVVYNVSGPPPPLFPTADGAWSPSIGVILAAAVALALAAVGVARAAATMRRHPSEETHALLPR